MYRKTQRNNAMPGIYLHIPFCKTKCHYCNFFSTVSQKHVHGFVDALLKEIVLRKNYLNGETINTIYFGGGTPGLLSIDTIRSILNALFDNFDIASDAEITLEANPDDLTNEKLKELSQTPINRLSIGIQSFDDSDLKFLNRVHDSERAVRAIEAARAHNFDNLSVDLIYGIQGSSNETWKKNLAFVHKIKIPHISCYALTVEPKTPMEHFIRKGKMPNVNEDQTVNQFEILQNEMENYGYVHYEISNYSLPGKYSRHNTAYWQGIPYLGLGPSAHSFDGKSRAWNAANISKYIRAMETEQAHLEIEHLSLSDHYNERVMTGIRTIWGINLKKIAADFGDAYSTYLLKQSKKHIDKGNVRLHADVLSLSKQGKILADGIAADLFYDD